MNNIFENFTGVFEVSKTLKFRLIPDSRSEKYLAEEREKDFLRSQNYPVVKGLIDDAYRKCIDHCYSDIDIDFENLYEVITNKDNKENISEVCKEYRIKLHSIISKNEEYKNLVNSKFLEALLKDDSLSSDEKKALEAFKKFTVYFIGFYENRKNVFSIKEIPSSLFYRMIDENFFTFAMNKKSYEQVKNISPEIITAVENNLKKGGYLKESENLDEYFTVNAYNRCLTQKNIDKYNTILGGYAEENIKYTGLNQEINLYNQSNKDEFNKLKRMIPLKKQILSKKTESFIEKIDTDQELYDLIKDTIYIDKENDIFNRVSNIINGIGKKDLSQIYISTSCLNKISFRKYRDYSRIINNIKCNLEQELLEGKKSKKLNQKETKKIMSTLGISEDMNNFDSKFLTLSFVNKYLKDEDLDIITEYNNLIDLDIKDAEDRFEEVYDMIESIDSASIKNENNIQIFKTYCDSVQRLIHDYKFLNVKSEVNIDLDFYYEYMSILNVLNTNTKALNLVRNYVTKVSYSESKFKLNFSNPTLASGWSISKERDNKSVILRKDGKYYLGIMNKKNSIKFEEMYSDGEEVYQKMIYNFFPGPNKMLPRCMFPNEVKKHFKESESDYSLFTKSFDKPFIVTKELYDAFNIKVDGAKKFQKEYYNKHPEDVKGHRDNLKIAIDGCKRFLNAYKSTKIHDYSIFKSSEEYNDISEFYKEVSMQSYKVEFKNISADKIDSLVEKGDLYLFQIYNKDFSDCKSGKENLHTMYFKALFNEMNLKNTKIRLSGNAELFYREKSISNPTVHEKGEKIINKTYKENGIKKSIPDDIILEINQALKNGSEKYISDEAKTYLEKATIRNINNEIIKDKRYTQSQYYFHFPIKFNPEVNTLGFNKEIANEIIKNKGVNIIGIDRGERNLLYVTVIDKEGKILEQKSLNIIGGYDYQDKLDKKEKNRQEARKSWKTIGNIKNLKEGYISQAVHEIVKLVIEYQAIIIMENLNVGFKRGRMKVEKQVYQKFENMLANKLNFLVFKDKNFGEIGSVYRAYQLAETADKAGDYNNGIINYVPAGYTSKIDPITGFVSVFRLPNNRSIEEVKSFLEKFDSIKYDKCLDMFRFDFNYDNFDINQPIFKKDWSIYTNGYRIITQRNSLGKWDHTKVDLTNELKALMDINSIEYENEKDLKDIILSDKNLIEGIYKIFRYTLQMRNSNNEEDSIISPVMYKGEFFNTNNLKDEHLPKDADANGAYNIARKGLLAIKNLLDESTSDEKVYIKTSISNKDWYEYIQNK